MFTALSVDWLKATSERYDSKYYRTCTYLCTFGLNGLLVSISDNISVRESSCRSKLVCFSNDFYTNDRGLLLYIFSKGRLTKNKRGLLQNVPI